MRDNYLCVNCGRPAEEVHHIQHLTPKNINDLNVCVDPSNLASLCKACHFEEHRGDHAKGLQTKENPILPQYYFNADGYLVECIPPGANA